MAIEPSNIPLASAVVLLPSPTAKLVAVLVQPLPLPTPLIDAQVAFAAPAPLRVAMANARGRRTQQQPARKFVCWCCLVLTHTDASLLDGKVDYEHRNGNQNRRGRGDISKISRDNLLSYRSILAR